MIINSVGSTFPGNSGSGQNTGGTSNQSDPAADDSTTSGSDQTGGTEASGSAGSSSNSQGSSGGQAGGQTTGQSAGRASSSGASSQQAAAQTEASTPAAVLSVEAEKPPVDEDALRTQALEAQKRLNTEMLIKSLGAAPETGLSLLSEAETETPVPLAVAAYAENFAPSAADPAKAAA